MTRLLLWWNGAGVQIRSTIAATALQAVVVLAVGVVLLLTLQHNLDTTVDASTNATAQGLAALLDPVSGEAAVPSDVQEAIDSAARRRAVVQVINASGHVLATSSDLSGYRALTSSTPPPGTIRTLQLSLPFDDDPYRFTALGLQTDSTQLTLLVGESLGTGDATLHAALVAMAVAGPLLLMTVAGATYLFIGHSLRPVADIRSTVDRITHRDLFERVPVPPGNDEVSKLARTMNAMLGDLQRSNEAQRRFVSDASHELRSPVATLLAAADIALTLPGHQQPMELPRLVRGEARRLDRLVADLLLLARLDERRPAGHRDTPTPLMSPEPGDPASPSVGEEVDLDDLITDEARRLRASTPLTVRVRREPVRVRGQRHELSRALRNLTDNAARHAATTVSLRVFLEGERAVLEVANDGQPISAEAAERIFDRFVRLEESRARDLGGSGLGLAIVREVVRAHRGRVHVVRPAAPGAPPGGGAGEEPAGGSREEVCFRIELPSD